MALEARAFQLACRARFSPSSKSALPAAYPLLQRLNPSSSTYATQSGSGGSNPKSSNKSSAPTRRAITVTTDDGRYDWAELSTSEKASRTTQQSFNFLLVAAGAAGTVVVAYLLYAELFAADSKTRQFNHAVDKIKADARCREILGPSNTIIAYGEPTSNKWARARPLAHSTDTDRFNVTHFRMHFHVEGERNRGVVNVHMTKSLDETQLRYRLLSLNVPGHDVVYLENTGAEGAKKTVRKIFGLKWT